MCLCEHYLGIGTKKDEAEARRYCQSILAREIQPWDLTDDGFCQELADLRQLHDGLMMREEVPPVR